MWYTYLVYPKVKRGQIQKMEEKKTETFRGDNCLDVWVIRAPFLFKFLDILNMVPFNTQTNVCEFYVKENYFSLFKK